MLLAGLYERCLEAAEDSGLYWSALKEYRETGRTVRRGTQGEGLSAEFLAKAHGWIRGGSQRGVEDGANFLPGVGREVSWDGRRRRWGGGRGRRPAGGL